MKKSNLLRRSFKENDFFGACIAQYSPITKLLVGGFIGMLLIPFIIQNSETILATCTSWSLNSVPLIATNRGALNATSKLKIPSDTINLNELNDTISIHTFNGTLNIRKLSAPVAELVQKIRAATLAAAGGVEIEFSEADEHQWNLMNPCRSRSELTSWYQRRQHVKDIPTNWQWDLVLGEYAKLHRTCMRRVGNLTDYLLSGNKSIECQFLVGEFRYGLGNKILHLTSSFMYAVLSQRVFLVSAHSIIPEVMCEPFMGSSWTADEVIFLEVRRTRINSRQLYRAVDAYMEKKSASDIHVSAIDNAWGPEPRFFCETEQQFLTKVTWLTLNGCVYFLPKLFTIPSFRTVMEALFPGKIALPVLLRSVMLPVDLAWERIVEVLYGYIGNAEMQIGIQDRYLAKTRQYDQDHLLVNERITRCVLENNILPDVCEESEGRNGIIRLVNCTTSRPKQPRVIKVFVASLYTGLVDHLNSIYLRHVTVTGDAVSVVQLTHERVQKTGVEVDTEALVEIITLSFSDTILITPFSTFGHVAAAYGGLAPWFINHNSSRDDKTDCQNTLTKETCYLGAAHNFDCKYNPGFESDKKIFQFTPYLSPCLAMEQVDLGLMMLTTDS